jgi:hypothetical protein
VKLGPGDRFVLHGFRVVLDRDPWPRWLGWLRALLDRWWPPLRGAVFTLTVNGKDYLRVPITSVLLPAPHPPPATALNTFAIGNKALTLMPTDTFSCSVKSAKLNLSHRVTVMLDGYLVRGGERVYHTLRPDLSNPEGA